MTNMISITIVSALVTNWFTGSIQVPTDVGCVDQRSLEVAVVVSNRFALIEESSTNRIKVLISAEILPTAAPITKKPPGSFFYTLTASNNSLGGLYEIPIDPRWKTITNSRLPIPIFP